MAATAMAQNLLDTSGAGYTQNFTNGASATGRFVLCDPLSGPTGSPKAGATSLGGNTTYPTNSGALSNCIGLGPANDANSSNQTTGNATIATIDISPNTATATSGASSRKFIDDLVIGARAAWQQTGQVQPVAQDSCMMYVGGGRSNAPISTSGGQDGTAAPNPYTAGTLVYGFGNGGNRDAGAGPAFTGFPSKIVTSTAGVLNGVVVEAGWVNRTGGAMLTGQNTFGSSVAPGAAVA